MVRRGDPPDELLIRDPVQFGTVLGPFGVAIVEHSVEAAEMAFCDFGIVAARPRDDVGIVTGVGVGIVPAVKEEKGSGRASARLDQKTRA